MNGHRAGIRVVVAALGLALGLLAAGCGDKIAIPQPSGVYSLNRYVPQDTFVTEGQAIQLTEGRGALYLLTPGTLSKRDTEFGVIEEVPGLAGPLSLCIDGQGEVIFVWENDAQRVSWFDAGTLAPLGSAILTEVQTAVAMATNSRGIDQVPGAQTYLYLSDPPSGVIHRFAFSAAGGLSPFGILARADGEGARFVHQGAGMTTDSEDYLLVVDSAPDRNWVIRFLSTPDPLDTSNVPGQPNPMRGFAALFDTASCEPPAATDYVIGYAAGCQQSDWVGGPSSEDGYFNHPLDVAVDGTGRIFVADTGNSRIQVFNPEGDFNIQFVVSDSLTGPTSLGVFDENGSAPNVVDYAGFIFMTLENSDQVYKFISADHYRTVYGEDYYEQ